MTSFVENLFLPMELIKSLIDFVLHIDVHLVEIVNNYQAWTYLILFFIIFAETGLVVTPFLPGDSLLFAAGAVVAKPDAALTIWLLWSLLMAAAVAGNLVNYRVGLFVGPRAFSGRYKLIKIEYLIKAQHFYSKYGGKTIIYARFIPIIRTFAPFVAGIGMMSYGRFMFYNIVGSVAWVTSFLFLGYYFGGLPVIKENFTYVIFVIIFVSLLPALIGVIRQNMKPKVAEVEKPIE
jgi:membrane-associated protein